MKTAFITGITGQDGSYLAELLLSKGYTVHGLVRRSSSLNTSRIQHLITDPEYQDGALTLHYGDLSDSEQISHIIRTVTPDEVYNLGAQSHVRVSFDTPEYTGNTTGIGTTRLLEAIRRNHQGARYYQASSSELYGSTSPPQDEESCFHPRSPYACAKLYAYWMTRNYREGYGMYACNGILFNHESPRRGETFVTRKITRGIARILAGKDKILGLGNLDARRDWGFSPEYVEGMWRILQQAAPDDFVVGTGEAHSVREFVEEAFAYTGLSQKKHLVTDQKYLRPTEVNSLVADARKAERMLGWKPVITFRDLVRIMIDADMRAEGLESIGEGDLILSRKMPGKYWEGD